jgi:hypothetical protein
MSNRWRLLQCFLQVAGIILVGGAAACSRCGSDLEVSIGPYESRDIGVRSSIQKLAAELRQCPQARLYRVIWRSPDPEGNEVMERQAILYDREHKRLGYEHDIYSGIAGKAYIVDDDAIQKVAERGGSLEAFVEYDQGSGSSK